MCGITGYWSDAINTEEMETIVRQMSTTLHHRGPDDGGIWLEKPAGLALGHRRLSIVDLSPQGHQPMQSANGRYVLVFNGEIYNFSNLRQQLMGLYHTFKGNSDTEVMLAAFCEWGVRRAVEKFVGMFAFAVWDRQERILTLGRDRLGEKPLYYGWMGPSFLFGSELKSLIVHPHWQGEIDRNVLTLFLRYNYIPDPYCIYVGIHKLLPGNLLILTSPRDKPKPQPYWSFLSAVERGKAQPFRGDKLAAINELDSLLKESIKGQMLADVPLGAFLSGGIDSSTVVALMQSQSSQPVKTFTIGFNESAYNEATNAKAVAEHLGTDHTELYVTTKETQSVIPKLPTLYDEPFSDSSQIPTFLVSQLARQQVTVSLSGDGGDELFGGYNRYIWASLILERMDWLPLTIRKIIASVMTSVSTDTYDSLFDKLSTFLPKNLKQRLPGDKIHKLARVLSFTNQADLYRKICYYDDMGVVIGGADLSTNPVFSDELMAYPEWMMAMDATSYLPGDILTKVDRAAMGVSLETRIPFLDHRVIEFSNTLPLEWKIHGGQTKWILRQVLYKYVPPHLIDRPKTGFGIPLENWLRHDLREWAEDLLSSHRLSQDGFFHTKTIRQKWEQHLSGGRNWQHYLWSVLVFQMWYDGI